MKDRGHKKWTTLMLPEHKLMLRAWQLDQEKISPPLLAEDQLEELQFSIEEYSASRAEVEIKYYNKGSNLEVTGLIYRTDPQDKILFVKVREDNSIIKIPFLNLISIQHNY